VGGEGDEIVLFLGDALLAFIEGEKATLVKVFTDGLEDGDKDEDKDENEGVERELVNYSFWEVAEILSNRIWYEPYEEASEGLEKIWDVFERGLFWVGGKAETVYVNHAGGSSVLDAGYIKTDVTGSRWYGRVSD